MSHLLRKALKAERPPALPDDGLDDEEEEADNFDQDPSGAFKAPQPKQGYEALTWDKFFEAKLSVNGIATYTAGSNGPYVLLLHGAGHTAMSWALSSCLLREHCRVIAYDMRGHGSTQVEKETEYSLENLCNDALKVLSAVIGPQPTAPPKVVVVGHSMGGAIAVRVAKKVNPQWLRGLIVIDVVEGTALEALPSMHRIIATRPSSFVDMVEAVRWAKASQQVRNLTSARISIPSQLTLKQIGDATTFTWRTDLAATEPYWKEWFTNLSKDFLSVVGPKMLLLAGTDRLDKDLTIGQMQGKFQLEVIPQVGHVIQEDAPEQTCQRILQFIHKFVAQLSVGGPGGPGRAPVLVPPRVGTPVPTHIPQNHVPF